MVYILNLTLEKHFKPNFIFYLRYELGWRLKTSFSWYFYHKVQLQRRLISNIKSKILSLMSHM